MDNDLVLLVAGVIAVIMIFAQVKLFSIDATLKDILAHLQGRETSEQRQDRERKERWPKGSTDA
jgi:hypothetical protein